MKQPPHGNTVQYTFSAYGKDHVCVNAIRYDKNLIVMPDRLVEAWTPNVFDLLTLADMTTLAALDANVILFGTGNRLRFPPSVLMQPLAEAGKTLDVMDIHAVCRTYNLLSGEGRRIAAVLLFD